MFLMFIQHIVNYISVAAERDYAKWTSRITTRTFAENIQFIRVQTNFEIDALPQLSLSFIFFCFSFHLGLYLDPCY